LNRYQWLTTVSNVVIGSREHETAAVLWPEDKSAVNILKCVCIVIIIITTNNNDNNNIIIVVYIIKYTAENVDAGTRSRPFPVSWGCYYMYIILCTAFTLCARFPASEPFYLKQCEPVESESVEKLKCRRRRSTGVIRGRRITL